MPSSAPFNHIVTWTWHLLALAATLFYYGWTSSSSSSSSPALLGTLLLSGAYALGSGIAASNACAAVRFARGETEAFGVCDAVGVAVGAAVEGAVVGSRLTDEDWALVGRASERARKGVVGTVAATVDRVAISLRRAP